jgi:hypothetical protein
LFHTLMLRQASLSHHVSGLRIHPMGLNLNGLGGVTTAGPPRRRLTHSPTGRVYDLLARADSKALAGDWVKALRQYLLKTAAPLREAGATATPAPRTSADLLSAANLQHVRNLLVVRKRCSTREAGVIPARRPWQFHPALPALDTRRPLPQDLLWHWHAYDDQSGIKAQHGFHSSLEFREECKIGCRCVCCTRLLGSTKLLPAPSTSRCCCVTTDMGTRQPSHTPAAPRRQPLFLRSLSDDECP